MKLLSDLSLENFGQAKCLVMAHMKQQTFLQIAIMEWKRKAGNAQTVGFGPVLHCVLLHLRRI